MDEAALYARLRVANDKLLAVRSKRRRPLVDTKIITGWNGLMIRGLADAGRVFENDAYKAAAARAADFVLKHARDGQGRLQRTYAAGQAKVLAYLDDYAYLADGLIALHQATGDERWLQSAGELTEAQLRLFWDDQVGGFFYTSSEHEVLIARSKLPVDGATPSAGAVAAGNLVYLAPRSTSPSISSAVRRCLRSSGPLLEENPEAVVQTAVALSAWLEAGGGK